MAANAGGHRGSASGDLLSLSFELPDSADSQAPSCLLPLLPGYPTLRSRGWTSWNVEPGKSRRRNRPRGQNVILLPSNLPPLTSAHRRRGGSPMRHVRYLSSFCFAWEYICKR